MPSPKLTYPVGAKVVCIHPGSKYNGVEGVVTGHSEDLRRVHVKWPKCPDILQYRRASLVPAPFKSREANPSVRTKATGPMSYTIRTYNLPPTMQRVTSEQPTRNSAL